METRAKAVSIEEALNRAFWQVKVPSMALLLGPWVASIIAMNMKLVPSMGYAGMAWFLPPFVVGIILGWVCWSVQVPKWRLWAYQRVSDIAALKAAAIAGQIVWPDDSVFTRTEIMSAPTRHKLRQLERSNVVDDGAQQIAGADA
jgi:hypothetical protein